MSLKVFDLQCSNGHVFEGWFSQNNSFEKQASEGLLTCPVCGDDAIERKLSAPRLNLGKSDAATVDVPEGSEQDKTGRTEVTLGSAQMFELQARLLQQMREVVKKAEDVGPRFAQEALKIHQGEAERRMIRGTATTDEQRELLDEGIMVMPVPDFLNDDQLQ